MVKLTDLLGPHTLSGFDTSIPNKKLRKSDYDNSEADDGICLILNNKKYQIYCDPVDGYRSYLTDLYNDESVKCSNCFESEYVLIIDASTIDNHLEGIFILSMTGKTIGKIVTDRNDKWYPCARVEWYPENLLVNQQKKSKLNIFGTDIPLKQIEIKNSGINNVYYQIDDNKSFEGKLYFCEKFIIKEHYDEADNFVILSFGISDVNYESFYPFMELCDKYQIEMNFGNIIWRNDID